MDQEEDSWQTRKLDKPMKGGIMCGMQNSNRTKLFNNSILKKALEAVTRKGRRVD